MATIGLVDVFGAPTQAQSADVAAELVSVNVDGTAVSGANSNPAVSNDGTAVVFTTLSPSVGAEADAYNLNIRFRATDATVANLIVVPLSSPQLVEAGISGDGCVVAYSVVVPRPAVAAAIPADQVVPVDGAVPVDEVVPVDGAAETAALQVAADVIELRTLNLCGAQGIAPVTTVLDQLEGHDPLNVQPLSGPSLSTDGSIVAFAATTTLNLYKSTSTPAAPAFVAITPPAAIGVDGRIGSHVDLTADGNTVVFEAGLLTADPQDPANAIDASVYVATVQPAAPVVTTEPLAPTVAALPGPSSWPSISADGSLVVYQSDKPLPITGAPDTGSYVVLADRSEAPTTHRVITIGAARPDLAPNGTAMVYDVAGSVQVRRSASAVPFAEFSERIVNPRVGVGFVEGAGASISGAVVSGDATAIVFDQADGAALSAPVVAGAQVWLQAAEPLFAPPPTTTTTTSTTTTSSTVPTRVTTPVTNTTRNTTRNTTQTTTRNTTSNTTRTTPATTPPAVPVVTFDPAVFEFAPTIINAGSRTAAIELSNPTTGTVTVSSITADPASAADFTADGSACSILAPGATCTVSLVFAPTATGERTATVVATMDDGTTASVALRGLGAPEPTISVLPGVASNGQVVAAVGSGFPAGATVDFIWNDGRPTSILIDDQGGFSKAVVVLPNTPSGPTRIAVAAQLDLFGEVSTTLLVSDSAGRGNTAVLGGGLTGASLGR